MKRIKNNSISNLSIIRTADQYKSLNYYVRASSTSRDYKKTFVCGVLTTPAEGSDFTTVVIDLMTNTLDSGEYVFEFYEKAAYTIDEPFVSDTRHEILVQIYDDERESNISNGSIYDNAVSLG